jgi:hypothetical protein
MSENQVESQQTMKKPSTFKGPKKWAGLLLLLAEPLAMPAVLDL